MNTCDEKYCDELDTFADWIFGPDGVPGLLILAYGDFAARSILGCLSRFYCRNSTARRTRSFRNFEILEPRTNKLLWEFVEENMDALTACTPYISSVVPAIKNYGARAMGVYEPGFYA